MRSLTQPLHGTVHELQGFTRSPLHGPSAEFLCQVELGLHLQQQRMPNAPAAHAWVLFSGHVFAKAYGVPLSPDAARALKVVRTMDRGRAWGRLCSATSGSTRPCVAGTSNSPISGRSAVRYRWEWIDGRRTTLAACRPVGAEGGSRRRSGAARLPGGPCRRPWQSPGVRPVESRLMATRNPGGWPSGLRCS